ncbi:GNAT family N-acetyltransferase [Corynebacterium pacaense]|uniref:GNAT family N-acetyltransferase n=1 Tax=Corynebacterium pacaense TaxID=1816684 RepID=UPI001C4DF714|nr:GNAT family N-acetyltransferase [Corynebacterium pacaense]
MTTTATETETTAPGVGNSGTPGAGLRYSLVTPEEYGELGGNLVAWYEATYPITDSYRERILDVSTRATENQVWVVRDGHTRRMVGTFVVARGGERLLDHALDGEFSFKLLGVDPQFRRRGIASHLIGRIEEIAADRGFSRVVLNSVDYMVPAHRLYEKLGYRRIRERSRTNPDGNDVFVFGKYLRPQSR